MITGRRTPALHHGISAGILHNPFYAGTIRHKDTDPLLIPEEEYRRQKRLLEMELKFLVVPQANAAEEAGKLVQDLPQL